MTTPFSFNGFVFDDGLASGSTKFARLSNAKVYGIPSRQLITTVVGHTPGSRRTASRDVDKLIQFTGCVFGNPAQDEATLQTNIDTLLENFDSGVGPLCVHQDGRFWNAELESIDIPPHPGSWYADYTATFRAYDPWAYAATPNTPTIATAQTMSNVSGTLYQYTFNLGNANQLGSAPSAVTLAVTLVTAHGCFLLKFLNNSASPVQTCAVAKAPFADGDLITFDGPNAQATITPSGGSAAKSDLPVSVITLDQKVAAPSSCVIQARATSAPVITVTANWSARYR